MSPDGLGGEWRSHSRRTAAAGVWTARPRRGESTTADFLIVIAAAAAIGLAALASPVSSPAEAALVPPNAPAVGFRTYPDAAACEQATSALVAPAGRRSACLLIERGLDGPADPY